MSTKELLEYASITVEIVGVLLIVGGLLYATSRWLFSTKPTPLTRYQRYRENLGCAILLGLEVLVLADMVRSVALDPTVASLGVLAMIVAVRTFLFDAQGGRGGQRPRGELTSRLRELTFVQQC